MKRLIVLLTILTATLSAYAQHDEAQKAMMEKYMKEHGEEGMAKLQEMLGAMTDADAKDVYTFPIAIDMTITSYKDDKAGEKHRIKYYVNNSDGTFAFQSKDGGKPMMMVYDTKANTMVIFNEEEQTYMAMNIEAFTSSGMMDRLNEYGGGDHSYDNITCKKSAKSKTVKGYSCEQLVCENEERNSKAEMWLTDKLPVNISKAAKNTPWATYFHSLEGMTGMMLEGKFYEDNKLQASLEVTEISEKANYNISSGKYNKMNMFGGQR